MGSEIIKYNGMTFKELFEDIGNSNLLIEYLESLVEYGGCVDMGENTVKEREKLIKQIGIIADANCVEINDAQVDNIIWEVGCMSLSRNDIIKQWEKDCELIDMIVAIHSNKRIKVGCVEFGKYWDKKMKGLMIDVLAKTGVVHFRHVGGIYRKEDIINRILNNDREYLLIVKSEVEERLKTAKRNAKPCNLIKYFSQKICTILHPDYLEYKNGLPKKEVCFIYDLLVFVGLKDRNLLFINDDKYDSIKRFFKKVECPKDNCIEENGRCNFVFKDSEFY